MKALFDQNSILVGWLSDNHKHLFDTALNWVAFVSSDSSVWTTGKKTWVGNLYGTNIRDTNGKIGFWNPETPINNTLKPLTPLKPLNPLTPLKPIKPLMPLKPLKPLAPIGGWSTLNWMTFINL